MDEDTESPDYVDDEIEYLRKLISGEDGCCNLLEIWKKGPEHYSYVFEHQTKCEDTWGWILFASSAWCPCGLCFCQCCLLAWIARKPHCQVEDAVMYCLFGPIAALRDYTQLGFAETRFSDIITVQPTNTLPSLKKD